jgi:hypothetical protein
VGVFSKDKDKGPGPTDEELAERAEAKRLQAEEEIKMGKASDQTSNGVNPIPNVNSIMPHRQVRVRAGKEGGATLYGLNLRSDAWTIVDLTMEQIAELGQFKDVVVDDGSGSIPKVEKKDQNDPSTKTDNTPMDDAKPGVSISKNLGGPTIAPNDRTGKG